MSQEGREAYKRVCDKTLILSASIDGARAELKSLSRRNPFAPELISQR